MNRGRGNTGGWVGNKERGKEHGEVNHHNGAQGDGITQKRGGGKMGKKRKEQGRIRSALLR